MSSFSSESLSTRLEQTSEELSQRTFELSMIQELMELAKDAHDTDDLLNLLMDKAMDVIGAQIGSVFVLETAVRQRALLASGTSPINEATLYRFRVAAAKGHDKGLEKGKYLKIKDSVAREVILEKKPLLILDIEKDARTHKQNDPQYGPPSFLSMPIFIGNAIYAVLNLSFNKSGQPFTEHDERALAIMLRNISFALENAILQTKLKLQMERMKGHNIALEKEIEGRKRTERALGESEKQYRLLVENSNDIIYTITLSGYFVYVNPVAERITGFTQAQLVGKHYLNLVKPDFHEEIETLYKKQFLDKTPGTYFEFPIIIQDGSTKWVGQNVQLMFKDDKYTGFQASARDITDRKLAEEALMRSKERFRTLADSTFEGIIIHDNGQIIDINRSAMEMFGYSQEESVKRNVIEFVAPDSVELILEKLRESKEKKEHHFEMNGVKKDGTVFPVEIFGRSIPDEHPTARVVAIRDITARRQAEEKIRENERILKETQEISKIGGWEYDIATGKSIWSDEVYRIRGLSPTADYNPSDLESNIASYAPEHQEIVRQSYLQTLQGEPFDIEVKLTTAQGLEKWVRTMGKPIIKEGKVVKVFGNIMDITDMKREEEEITALNIKLAKANKELEQAYAWMRDSRDNLMAERSKELTAFLVDKEGVISGITEEVIKYIEKSRGRIIGAKITDLLLDEYRDDVTDALSQAWIGLGKQISVKMSSTHEASHAVNVKMTRFTLDARKLLLVTMQ